MFLCPSHQSRDGKNGIQLSTQDVLVKSTGPGSPLYDGYTHHRRFPNSGDLSNEPTNMTKPAAKPITNYYRVHAKVWFTIACIALLLAVLNRFAAGQDPWQGWAPSGDFTKPKYAESIHSTDLFRTRANTWSNLAYVVVGLYAIAMGLEDRRKTDSPANNYLIRTPPMSILFGVACCYLGLGSGLFHASLTRWGQQLDVGSMYAPLLSCIAINLGRYAPEHLPTNALRAKHSFPTWPILALGVIAISYLLYYYKWSMSANQVLPLHILLVSLFAIADLLPQRVRLGTGAMQFRWVLLGLCSLVAAVVCRELDVAGKFSGPDAWYQGHAIWHLLTALSLGCMYWYYRTETCSEHASSREVLGEIGSE